MWLKLSLPCAGIVLSFQRDSDVSDSSRTSFPSFSIADVLCDPSDLIWKEGTPFEAMTGRTAPSSNCFLAEVFRGFPQP